MLYIFFGQSCTGKSTAAEAMKAYGAKIYSGKDYLRLAKSERDAWQAFVQLLDSTRDSREETLVYIVTEKQQFQRVETLEGAVKVKFTAALETVKSRFAQRTAGKLPAPVEKMLERQYEEWKDVEGDLLVDTTEGLSEEQFLLLIS